MRPYFAYGSNMDASQMARRCPGAGLLGTATVAGLRFVVTRAGYASVVPDSTGVVYGVLWSLAPADEVRLDVYEGVAEGLYGKATVRVQRPASHEPIEALLYVATDPTPGRPKAGYLERVVDAARRHGLPPAYVAEIAGW